MSDKSHKNIIDSLIKDKHGKIVVAQFPNIPIAGWILFSILGSLIKHGKMHTGFQDLAQASLFVWAYLEVKMGDSVFRRILGGLVLLSLIVGFFRN